MKRLKIIRLMKLIICLLLFPELERSIENIIHKFRLSKQFQL